MKERPLFAFKAACLFTERFCAIYSRVLAIELFKIPWAPKKERFGYCMLASGALPNVNRGLSDFYWKRFCIFIEPLILLSYGYFVSYILSMDRSLGRQ